MTKSEGYIKFKCDWEKQNFWFPTDIFNYINRWRQKLFNLGFIGAYDNGVGFGNLSIRVDNTNKFIISGSATGNHRILNKTHYAKVTDYDLNHNYVRCTGKTKASSESLTHAAIYESSALINSVVHTHNITMWQKLINIEPTTLFAAGFGTPEIALEIKQLMNSDNIIAKKQIIVMGGHQEGIITFGKDLSEAVNILISYKNKVINQK